MKTQVMAIALLIVCAVAVYALVRSVRGSHVTAAVSAASAAAAKPALPTRFASLRVGMTKGQVLSSVGRPNAVMLDKRYEAHTPQQWAQIEAKWQALNARPAGSSAAAPSMTQVRLGAQLAHRIKETLRYDPNKTVCVEMAFDGTGHLLQINASPQGNQVR